MTGEAGHTPAPWVVEDPFGDYLSIVVGDETYDWRFVAHVHTDIEKGSKVKPISKAQMEANARLIAAAPDMYEAPKKARDVLAVLQPNNKYPDGTIIPGPSELLRAIDAAIAKAEGRAASTGSGGA